MAFQVVHTFTIGLCQYDVMVDFDAGLTDCISSCLTPATVTEAELGQATGFEYAWTCVGTTKVHAIASLSAPFVTLTSEPNSVDCGWEPPPCIYTFDVNTTNATNGGNSGSLTVSNVTQIGTFTYSLDNFNWQTSPVFNFLFPGTYNVYVQNITGCIKSKLATVGNTVTAPVLPTDIPYYEARKMCFFFWLIIDGVTNVIREPIKWGEVNIMGERDPEFHGYLFKYSDGNITLGFDCAAGMQLIEAVYNDKGQDGDIKFRFGYTYNAINYLLFSGKLMLNTYEWFAEKVECAVETEDLDTVFTSRMETKVSMTQDKSFDDEDVPVPTPYNIELHAKEILTKVYEDTQDIYIASFSGISSPFFYIKPDNTNITFAETADNYQYNLGAQATDPVLLDEYYFLFKNSGTATTNIVLDHVYTIQRIFNTDPTAYSAKVYYVSRKKNIATGNYDVIATDISASAVSGLTSGGLSNIATFSITSNYSITESFLAGDSYYIYVKIEMTGFGLITMLFNIAQNRFLLDVQYLENTPATNANAWFLEDVIRHCINVIGNNHYAFRSSFLERVNANQVVDGCGSKYIITNGFQIRQFEVATRPLKVDLKKMLSSVNSIFCIGLHYVNDVSGAFVRIERRDYFYKDREILAIYEVESYREQVAIDIIYNEIEIGYDKFQDSGFNSLDEFNTKTEWLTPIKKNRRKLPALASVISSGYSIESIRREQFSEKPSSSVTNDEEPFIVAVKRIDATTWETEKDEAFETVTGIISPSTAYNLRISPKRMLYNWLIWLKNIFYYKVSTDKILNTFIAQNNDLVTKFNVAETCRVGDVDRATLAEKDPILVSAMASTADLFQPERVFIKCRLNPQQVQVINLAMTSRYGDTKDRGYIMVKKPTGVWQAFWLEKLSYNFWEEKAELSGLKKYPSPDLPDAGDCCNWLVVNGCYILVNGDRLIA